MKMPGMRNLRTRLRRLNKAAPEPPPAAEPTKLRKRLRRMYSAGAPPKAAAAVKAPPAPVTEPAGAGADGFTDTWRYPIDRWHGRMPLGDVLEHQQGHLAAEIAKDADLEDFDPRRALYMDTETTGLESGTGTLVFLIGYGYFDLDASPPSFILRQELVRDYDDEPRALQAFCDDMERFDTLVTFNGKAFDVDRLKMRMTLSRISHNLTDVRHLDLLHSSRRLLGAALGKKGCSLKSIETHYLGLHRKNDVDGSEAPGRYFMWLQTRDADMLHPVMRHNRLDILSLVTLTSLLLERASDPISTAQTPLETYAAARYVLGHGEHRAAHLVEGGLDSALRSGRLGKRETKRARQDLAFLHKRNKAWDEAAALFRKMAKANPTHPLALFELAKIYEHRLPDYDEAEYWTRRLIQNDPDREDDHRRRLARILRKRDVLES